MSSIRSTLFGLFAAVAVFASASAFAHPRLVVSAPANNAVVPAPATIKLTFSETLLPKLSGAELTLTRMPGMEMPPMKIAARVAPSGDAKSLVLTPAKPLVPGTYRVDWHVVSGDTHAIKGIFGFTVR